MELFNRAVMNGATLFGVFLTLSALIFVLSDKLGFLRLNILFYGALLYFFASFFAFVFPSLSGVRKMKKETSFMRLKKAVLELKEGYPDHIFWGKVEYFMEHGKEKGWELVKLLVRHEIIEKITEEELDMVPQEQLARMPERRKDKLKSYRLTAKGVDLAISMINLEYAEKMRILTAAIFVLGALTFLLVLNQFLFPILF